MWMVLTPLWAIAKGFLTANGFLATLLIGGGLVLYTYDQSRVRHGRHIEANEREQQNADAVDLAKRGASGAGGKRVLDPYLRAEAE